MPAQKISEQTAKLTLYQFMVCPFCVKVRMTLKRKALNIKTRDANCSEEARGELLVGGGKMKVPCLKIEGEDGNQSWMYESPGNIAYLDGRFMGQQAG